MQLKTLLLLLLSVQFYVTKAQVDFDDIVFETTEVDFGTIILEDGIKIAKYNFTNNSDQEFRITNIEVACGCTNPRASKYSIAPGESGTISAEFNPQGMLGDVNKWIYVQGNYANGFQKSLSFKATIRSSKYRDPNSYYPGEFGYLVLSKLNLNLGNSKKVNIKLDSILVANDGYNEINIKSAYNLPSFIEIVNLPMVLKPKESNVLRFNVNPIGLDTVGRVQGTINLRTNDKFYPKKQITYAIDFEDDYSSYSRKQLKKAPKIAYMATTINLGNMKSGEKKSKPFSITNKGKTTLLIKRVDTDCTCAILNNLKRSINPGETIVVNAQFDALYKNGTQSRAITMYTNDPSNPKVIFSIAAQVN